LLVLLFGLLGSFCLSRVLAGMVCGYSHATYYRCSP